MEWLSENWLLVLFGGGMIAMHLGGHRHGGSGEVAVVAVAEQRRPRRVRPRWSSLQSCHHLNSHPRDLRFTIK